VLAGIFHILVCVGLTLGWQWPSVIFVVCGVMCFAVGPGPIPWMITSEILPPSVRAGGVTICVFTNWFFTFIVGQVREYGQLVPVMLTLALILAYYEPLTAALY
jgi:hypothetical protein